MSIEHVMERIGKIVAADQGVEVQVRGVEAYAVPGRVVIPSIEAYSWLGRNAERMLHGLLDHECGHAKDTHFEIVKKASEVGAAFKRLFNALEDGYVEARMGDRYVGSAQNLAAKNEWWWVGGGDTKSMPARLAEADPWTAFCLATTMLVRPFGGRRFSDFDAFPELAKMLRTARPELTELSELRSKTKATGEVFSIAERIYAKFDQKTKEEAERKAKEEEEKKESKGEEEGGGSATSGSEPDEDGDVAPDGSDEEGGGEDQEGESGDGDAEGEEGTGGGSEGEEDDGEVEGGEEAGGSGEGEGEGAGEDGDGEEEAPGKPPEEVTLELDRWTDPGTPLSPEDEIRVRVKKVFEQPASVQPYTVFSHEFDIERDFSSDDLSDRSHEWESAVQDAREASDALIQAFESALRAKRDRRPIGGHDEGFVDESLLGEYATGSCQADRLYQQLVSEDSDEVAVAVLLDCSGSMGQGHGSASWLARQSAIAIHLALSACQIAHEITGFTSIVSSDITRHQWSKGHEQEYVRSFERMRQALVEAEKHGTCIAKFAREVYHRTPGELAARATLQVPIYGIFKRFAGVDARGLMAVSGIWENLDGEAVLWQAGRLARRPETRRVMFVLSDGYPAGSRDNAQGARYLAESVRRVLEAGIEVYGIGMQSEAVREFYPQWWVARDMDDLSNIAFGSMTEVLTRSRTERTWVTL